MNHRKSRFWAFVVLLGGLLGEGMLPSPAHAAMLDDGYCAAQCSDMDDDCQGVPGSSCTIEQCFNHRGQEFPYVIRCAAAQ
jgi:hypothetical protein